MLGSEGALLKHLLASLQVMLPVLFYSQDCQDLLSCFCSQFVTGVIADAEG